MSSIQFTTGVTGAPYPPDTLPKNDVSTIDKQVGEWRESYAMQSRVELYDAIAKLMSSDHTLCDWSAEKIANILIHDVRYVRDELNTLWNNMGMVSGFVGAIALTVMLAPLEKSSGFQGSGDNFKYAAVAYYILWSFAAFFNITAMLMLLIVMHYVNYTIKEVDFLEFLVNGHIFGGYLQISFITLGCFCMIIASCMGLFVIGNDSVAWIAVTGSVVGVGFLMYAWVNIHRKSMGVRAASSMQILTSFVNSRAQHSSKYSV